ncbi:MAG TPA: carbohydrate binding domain-containing protein [Allosphingosinicella sp.]|nr:carbohydrate binding domain-containing protein [Allosphingosinicella sp.]
MKGRFAAFCITVAAVALPHVLLAQDNPDDLMKKIINRPPVTAWQLQGVSGKPNVRNDPAVQYGKALRIDVPGKGEHPWSIAASNAVDKPVKAGDNLVLAFWARLEKGENGATTATLPYNAVQMAADPYTAVIAQPVTIGPEWKMVQVQGKADRNYGAGQLTITVHLATAKQIVDLGPVFLLDMGP